LARVAMSNGFWLRTAAADKLARRFIEARGLTIDRARATSDSRPRYRDLPVDVLLSGGPVEPKLRSRGDLADRLATTLNKQLKGRGPVPDLAGRSFSEAGGDAD
jgi:hypothetical protein